MSTSDVCLVFVLETEVQLSIDVFMRTNMLGRKKKIFKNLGFVLLYPVCSKKPMYLKSPSGLKFIVAV